MNTHLPASPPPLAPQYPQNRWRRLCRWIVARAGWKLRGELPNEPRLILVIAPHSSFWDGVWGILFRLTLGLRIGVMIKAELFATPLGPALRGLGGIPIRRDATKGVVEQMVEYFAQNEKLWLAITPEGTRKPVKRWKTGFWHIAHHAGIPIQLVYFHYPEKILGFGPLLHTSNNVDEDMQRIQSFFTPFQGKHRGV